MGDNNKVLGHQSSVRPPMQVCTCARFRKRIEQSSDLDAPINHQAPLAPKMRQRNNQTILKASTVIRSELGSNEHIVIGRMDDTVDEDEDYAPLTDIKGAQRKKKLQSLDGDGLSVSSPSDNKNQPRMSQDFKMRILTKKKVAVPPSANS